MRTGTLKNKLCISTYVFGKYKSYIPLFIFFCKTTYPDAHPIIFAHQDLEERDSLALTILKTHFDFTIITDYMPDLDPSGHYGKSLRWLLWDNLFDSFEGIYMQIKHQNKLYVEIFSLLPHWIKEQLIFMEKIYQTL
jgi:hypothetical protein